jgi:hypothetical protein
MKFRQVFGSLACDLFRDQIQAEKTSKNMHAMKLQMTKKFNSTSAADTAGGKTRSAMLQGSCKREETEELRSLSPA